MGIHEIVIHVHVHQIPIQSIIVHTYTGANISFIFKRGFRIRFYLGGDPTIHISSFNRLIVVKWGSKPPIWIRHCV